MFANVSLIEEMPTPFLKALACSRTIIASRFSGVRHPIVDGGNEQVVTDNKAARIVEALLKLSREPSLSSPLAAKRRKYSARLKASSSGGEQWRQVHGSLSKSRKE
jgi:glycosyltransferase involved in cell wall biosynthesis